VLQVEQEGIGQIRRLVRRQRRQHFPGHVLVGVVGVLDIEARRLLERRHRPVELLILLRIIALVPPYVEIGRRRLQRHRGQEGGG